MKPQWVVMVVVVLAWHHVKVRVMGSVKVHVNMNVVADVNQVVVILVKTLLYERSQVIVDMDSTNAAKLDLRLTLEDYCHLLASC